MFSISKLDKYQSERMLINFNFSLTQRKRLLVVLEKKPELINTLNESLKILLHKNCGLTPAQITKIACDSNGSLNLKAFAKYYPKLKTMGYNFLHMIKITDYFDAYQILPILVDAEKRFKNEKFLANDMVLVCKIVENVEQFQHLRMHIKKLLEYKISPVNIEFLIKNDLLEQFMFFQNERAENRISNQRLDFYIRERTSIEQLNLYFQYGSRLKNLRLTGDEIYNLTSKSNAKEFIDIILTTFPAHIKNGFDSQKLLNILIAENGQENLSMLHELALKLLSYGYFRHEILKLLAHNDGAYRLQILNSRHLEYRVFNFTPVKIMTMVWNEFQNTEKKPILDDFLEYIKEIDMLREQYFVSEMKVSMSSLFKPILENNQDLMESGPSSSIRLV